jgi:endonuclease/exonuclease/phosphatase family metal-dependent hydrolase
MRVQAWSSSLIISTLVTVLGGCVLAEPVPRQQSAAFSLLADGPLFTFQYSVGVADPTNWIGVYYASGGGPVDQVHDEDALAWQYAPQSEGTVHVPSDSLPPGSYKAFFLASDGYQWLAEPLDIVLPDSSPFTFIVPSITLRNSREGDDFSASIGGFLIGSGSADASYSITSLSGAVWAKVSANGNITGIPSPPGGGTEWRVEAKSYEGSVAVLKVNIPVRPKDKALVDELRVMTYNLWHGGSQVSDYHKKQVSFLVDTNVDIVGLQESTPDHATRLARALGWYVWQDSDVGVISRYPIDHVYERLGSYAGGVRLNLDGECSQLNLWNVHLGYDPYGPYDFCFDEMSVEEVLEREAESGRTPQIIRTIEGMHNQLSNSDEIPVILLGDFNAPSHLDWTDPLKEKNCGYSNVPWPTSEWPVDAGMKDSFREAHPDPKLREGITWSPIFLENSGRPEPLDRIDFIYHKSDFEVLNSEDLVAGSPKPQPDHGNNQWTSDHAAVITTFKLSSDRCG